MGDGAGWIWNIASQQFPGAIQIVDLYHARQHRWNVARTLYPLDQLAQRRWILRHQPKLDGGRIGKLFAYLRSVEPQSLAAIEIITIEASYFEKNAANALSRVSPAALFVGSGVIEAGCKTVIGQLLKQSGMFWTVRGANAILALRCRHLNVRFESYWEARAVWAPLLCRAPSFIRRDASHPRLASSLLRRSRLRKAVPDTRGGTLEVQGLC